MRAAIIVMVCFSISLLLFAVVNNAEAAPTVAGKQWRNLDETTSMSVSQVAAICPTDGITPCGGNLSGWVWATSAQVDAIAGSYGLVPNAAGYRYFIPALRAVTDFKATSRCQGGTFAYCETAAGYVADGRVAEIYYQYPIRYGLYRTRQLDVAASPYRGVWLWKPVV